MRRGGESNVGNWTYCETCWEEISRIVADYLKGGMRVKIIIGLLMAIVLIMLFKPYLVEVVAWMIRSYK